MKAPLLKDNHQSGAVIILFALLLVAIFAFIALTIDTTLVTSSQSHFKTSADAAVLGALEEYGNQLGNGALPNDALTQAVNRANNLLGQNFTNNPGKFLQKQSTNTQNAVGTDCTSTAGNGCLRPIIWYPPVPPGPNCPNPLPAFPDPLWRPCACNLSCECGDGCLNDPMMAAPPRAGNGLKLRYRTDQNSPLKALFGAVISLMGPGSPQEIGMTVESIALLAPRNAMFLLDLSDSMVTLARASGIYPANFYDQNPATLPPAPAPLASATCFRRRYAYPILAANTCAPTSIEPAAPVVINKYVFPRASYNYCDMGNYPVGVGNTTAQYACLSAATSVPVQFDGGLNRQHNFLINTVVNPEPLTSALDAVNQAMNSFSTRRVPNDRLGIIGFDDQRINNRILAINKNNINTIQPAPLNDPDFTAFEQATRVVGATAIPITNPSRYSKYLFPRYYNPAGVGGETASDLPETFELARRMIKNVPNFRQAQNFVVMFSDGMTNCLDPDLGPYTATNPRCAPGQAHFTQSLNLLRLELANYAADRIAVHFFLLGAKSQPHRIAWRNSNGQCASIDEISQMVISSVHLPIVNAQGGYNSDGTALVNQIYPWVKATGGLWAPILDSYGVNPTGACPLINQNTFNTACNGLNNTANFNALTTSGATITNGMAIGGGAVWPSNPPYWDSRGRILCDPQNRSIAQQVNDYMKVILGKPPFVLVKPS